MLFRENKAGHGLTCTLVFMKADCKTFRGGDRLTSWPYTLEKDSSGGMTFKHEILTIQLQMTNPGETRLHRMNTKEWYRLFSIMPARLKPEGAEQSTTEKAPLDTVRATRAGKGYILLSRTGWMTLGDFPNLSELQFPICKREIIVLTLGLLWGLHRMIHCKKKKIV